MSKDIERTVSDVNNIRDTVPDVAFVSERAARRLVALVEELTREYEARTGKARGAQAEIARLFQTDQGNLSKLLSNERNSVGQQTVEKARKALNLKHEYFHGPREPRSYHDFIGGDLDAPYPAWFEFVETDLGKSMTAAERRTLASTRYESGDPTVGLYQAHLLALRGHIRRDQAERSEQRNRQLSRENDEENPPRK